MSENSRYFLELAYNGTNYHGWQVQPNAVTVQELLDKALSTVLRAEISTVGCGRTDTGVHAKQFYAHFDSYQLSAISYQQTMNSINALLPYEIAVKSIIPVHTEAHARFDATLRSYEYHIHFSKDPFRHGFSWMLRDVPDVGAMNEAAAMLMEYRDFSSFSKSNTQVFTNNCVVSAARWEKQNEGIVFHISADRFLRNMVRAIVGTLLDIGYGRQQPGHIRTVIEHKKRAEAGTSVPACGLYLTRVKYPYLTMTNQEENPNG